MEWSESPSKRRRTSRSTSIDVDVQNTQRTTASQNVDPRSTRRALFMFPTTASLACSNPHLLQPVSPSKPQGQVSRGSQQPYDRDTSVNGVASGASGIARPEVSTVLALTTAGANGTILAGDFHAKAPGLPATPSRRPRSPGGNTGPPKSNGSLVDQDPRASPPEEARETANRTLEKRVGQEVLATDNLNTAANSTHLGEDVTEDSLLRLPSTPTQRQLYGSANGMGQAEDGEPSLPSTPTQLGLEAPPEKPKGLLFSSPSRRSIRTKCLSAKSSPLKPKDPKPKDPAPQKLIFANPRPSSLGTRVNIAKTPRPPPTSQETELSKLKACLGQMEKELQETQAYLLLQLLLPRVQQDNGKVNKEIQKRKNEVVQGTAEIMHLRDEIARLQAKISSSTTAQPVDEVLADKAK
ncbi:hypothetical protein MMC28_005478 [Mycoblastus sanguinarius]|nr:hypothetical protein [Mycoblastus sanguinarius]